MAEETNDLTPEQMAARIAELETRMAKAGVLRFKVSEKGAFFRCTVWVDFRLLSTWNNGKHCYRMPTNCGSSSKLTDLNSRPKTASRIHKAFRLKDGALD
jgi:hypothetical protein